MDKRIPHNNESAMQHNWKLSKVSFKLLLNYDALERFIAFGIVFHNIEPLKFNEFFPYFVVLVPAISTAFPHLKL